MAQALDALIGAIHASPRRGVMTVTGGGSGLLSSLLAVAGASATVLEANIPYAARSLREWLGFEPGAACSSATACALAMRAFTRADELEGDFGFALTASLKTTRPKRGEHRAHLAFQDAWTTRTWTVTFDKNMRSRIEEERAVTRTAVEALAFALGVGPAPTVPGTEARGTAELADLLRGVQTHVGNTRFGALLPGAFNPLHDGHRAMRNDAARRLGQAVGYELCIANVDKPRLDYQDLNRRLAQFDPAEIVVTNTPTFVAKAQALGSVVFVTGADTVERIAAPRYYGSIDDRDAALCGLKTLGCRFLVYGRLDAGTFKTLDDLSLPPALAALCTGIPEAEFRDDASSTNLRGHAGRGHGAGTA